MTLSALRSELTAIRLHDLSDTNVASVEADSGCVIFETDDRDADTLSDLTKDLATVSAELKALEAEHSELRNHANELETALEADGMAHELQCAQMGQETFRQRAVEWALEVENMRAEVKAIRKRKDVEAGVCAYSRDVWTLLCYVSQAEGRYQAQASALISKIGAMR